MKKLFIIILLVCAWANTQAQTNYVLNGDFEDYHYCPDKDRRIFAAKHWFNGTYLGDLNTYSIQYNHRCGNTEYPLEPRLWLPNNADFYQEPRSKDGLVAVSMLYFDYSYDPKDYSPPQPSKYSITLRGVLQNRLEAGKAYCVSFYVNLMESAGYANNKIGAYLDDGSLKYLIDSVNKAVTSVTPQVYTNLVISDTANWTKIEGTFVAKGNENTITIGNFFPNSAVTAIVFNPFTYPNESAYLIDDVSVVAIDAKANAGSDRWVELGKSTQIGPVEDSTARGMDCKWYHKGKLIDSGNVITVNASTIKYAVDTYVVVQNVCGNITRDTMLLRTVGLGINGQSVGVIAEQEYSLFPNPNEGNFTIKQLVAEDKFVAAKVYDALGRMVSKNQLHFINGKVNFQLPQAFPGQYVIYIDDGKDAATRIKFTVK